MVFCWNAADQRFLLDEQALEPEDVRLHRVPCRGDTKGDDDVWEPVCFQEDERWD